MACIAANSLKMSGGSSRDNVRIVTDIAKLLVQGSPVDLDETRFWRERIGNRKQDLTTLDVDLSLEPNTIIALTKLFVLEWSVELPHEDLPLELLVV